MNIIDKSYSKVLSFCSILFVAMILGFASCSDDEEVVADPSQVTDPVIDKLELLITEIGELKGNSTFGLRAGMYPEESKLILTNAISSANRYILLIKHSNPAPTQTEKDEYLSIVSAAITAFQSTIRTEDAPTKDAYLFVDGNNEGYIDFGYSDEYVDFGNVGDQSFTVEMWVNIKEYCNLAGEDNSTFLSTFVQKNGTGEFFSGWRVQSRTRNIIRGSVGVKDVNNNARHLWEPAFSFTQTNQWVHVAFVYSDKGLDGTASRRSVMYRNGEQLGDVINIGETERQYNSADAKATQIRMTAFGRFDIDGTTRKEYFSGYIRKIRVWKTAKDAAYILASKEGSVTLNPSDADLVCAWDFEKASYDDEIVDITGRHTAKLVGPYSWEER